MAVANAYENCIGLNKHPPLTIKKPNKHPGPLTDNFPFFVLASYVEGSHGGLYKALAMEEIRK